MTLDEIRAEQERAQAAKDAEKARTQSNRGGRGGGYGGRGDSRNFSGGGGYGQMPPPSYHGTTNVETNDLRRLTSNARKASNSPASFGPTSMFSGRNNSSRGGRSLGPNLSGGGNDSGASSRTGTPPAKEKESSTSKNMFR
jgi:translation initiation factor 4G